MDSDQINYLALPLCSTSCTLDDMPHNFAHIKLIHVNARDLRVGDKLSWEMSLL